MADTNQELSNQVLTPTALVQTAPGSIVSRTLVDKPAGTVTLFAFAAGQRLSEHTAPYDALVQALAGRARFTVGGLPHELEAGQALIMPANVPHGVETLTDFKMMLTMIKA